MNIYTKAIPYFLTAMGGVVVTMWGTVAVQRQLNTQAYRACEADHYRKFVTFRGAAGDTSFCIPAYLMNGSVSHPD